MADPDFGERSPSESERKPANSGAGSTASGIIDFSRVYFGPLPATAEEARALGKILSGATILMREQATEDAIKKVDAPEILHVATHGFFLEGVMSPLPDDVRGLVVKKDGSQTSPTPTMRIDNPLLRSGLAFAGANQRQSGSEDGILTALEAAGLNLWGTKLVVLSACNTAVGEVKTGDGVFGLRRALVIAGAESQVMSLWPVSDQATRDLMIAYYKAMQAGRDQAEALRRVQLRMIAQRNYQHPYYWAAFIHSGRWNNVNDNSRHP
jgi:CHAT domain-containing protein